MGFIIFGAALLLVLGLLAIRIGVRIKYNDTSGLSAVVYLWRIPLKRIYPSKKKKRKPRPSRFTVKKIRRREERKRKRAEAKKHSATAKSKNTSRRSDSAKKKRTFSDKAKLVNQITRMILSLLSRFFSHLRTDVHRFRIRIGTEDAASTAIAYGAANAAAEQLFTLLEEKTDFRRDAHAITEIYADFLSEDSSADIDLSLSLRIHHLLGLALHAVIEYMKQNTDTLKSK